VLFATKISDPASYTFFSLMSLYIFLAGLFFGILALRVGVHALYLACSKNALKRVLLLFGCVFVLLVLRIPAYFVAMTGVLTRGHINFIISHISECMISFVVCLIFHERIGKCFKAKKAKDLKQDKIIEKDEQCPESGTVVEMVEEPKTFEEPQGEEPVSTTTNVETSQTDNLKLVVQNSEANECL